MEKFTTDSAETTNAQMNRIRASIIEILIAEGFREKGTITRQEMICLFGSPYQIGKSKNLAHMKVSKYYGNPSKYSKATVSYPSWIWEESPRTTREVEGKVFKNRGGYVLSAWFDLYDTWKIAYDKKVAEQIAKGTGGNATPVAATPVIDTPSDDDDIL